jgi:hypothetical protein
MTKRIERARQIWSDFFTELAEDWFSALIGLPSDDWSQVQFEAFLRRVEESDSLRSHHITLKQSRIIAC